jgi:hypothetical protein
VIRLILLVLSFITKPDSPDDCVRYWQRELGLEDWKIATKIVSGAELDYATLGDIEPDAESKTAVMRLRQTSDSDLRGRIAVAEQLNTVLHEMVHLRKFAAGERDWRIEAAVDREATRLVRKHRRWFESLAHEPTAISSGPISF